MRGRTFAVVSSVVLAAVAMSGSLVLGQDAEEAEEMAPGTTVGVQVQEWAVIPDTMSVSAGSVTFDVENTGPEDIHEFVIIRTDIPAGELPTGEDGAFDEEAEGIEVIDEIEDLEVGATESLTVDLEPGNYVLVCNLVEEEDGMLESHYQMGMWIGFEVTA